MRNLNEFIRENKKYWEAQRCDLKEEYVYIPEEVGIENFYADIVRYLSAKAIQEKKGYRVVRLTNKKEVHEKYRLAESFGITTKNIREGVTLWEQLYAGVKACLCFLRCRTGEELLRYKIEGWAIGRCIYDKMVREQERNSVNKLSIASDFGDVYDGLLLYVRLKRIFCKNPPKYLILNEMAYFMEIYRVVAQKAGAELLRASVMLRKEENVVNGFIHHSYYKLASDKLKEVENLDYESYIDNYFTRYFNGQSELSWVKNVNKNKEELSKEEVARKLGINEHKKTVFIMAHSLSDAPHCSEKTLHQDYYVALKETLLLASKINKVNWILKVHPSFKNYRGDNGMELVEQCAKDNVVIFDERYSNEVVFQIADAIITVQGTIGIEASALGIPVIVTGKAWYSGFGFTINAFSKKKFEGVLSKLDKIKKLPEEKRKQARKVFCAYLIGYNEVTIDKDEFGQVIFENMISSNSIEAKNQYVLDYMKDYIKHDDIRNTWIYQKTLEWM